MKPRLFFGAALMFAVAVAPAIALAVETPSKTGAGKPRGAAKTTRSAKPGTSTGTRVQQGSFKPAGSFQNKAVQVQNKNKATAVPQHKAHKAAMKQQKIENQKYVYLPKADRQKFGSGEYRVNSKAANLTNGQKHKFRKHARRHRHRLHYLARVSFLLAVGSYVPQSYAIYELPEDFYADLPEYRGYKYILVGNELLIINPRTWEIVAIVLI